MFVENFHLILAVHDVAEVDPERRRAGIGREGRDEFVEIARRMIDVDVGSRVKGVIFRGNDDRGIALRVVVSDGGLEALVGGRAGSHEQAGDVVFVAGAEQDQARDEADLSHFPKR